jgi:hypothetical protein
MALNPMLYGLQLLGTHPPLALVILGRCSWR